jgi:hypothetical protein
MTRRTNLCIAILHWSIPSCSGIVSLDEDAQIIGGGIPRGGIVMVMEDLEAPHHMLLMRYFMAQGLVHGQPLLYASPLPSPKSFLGTLPGLATGDDSKSSRKSSDAAVGLKVAGKVLSLCLGLEVPLSSILYADYELLAIP